MVFLSVSIRYINIFYVWFTRVMFIWAAFDRSVLALSGGPRTFFCIFLMQIVSGHAIKVKGSENDFYLQLKLIPMWLFLVCNFITWRCVLMSMTLRNITGRLLSFNNFICDAKHKKIYALIWSVNWIIVPYEY